MIAQRSGRLIGIASLSSFVGLHEVAAYGRASRGSRPDARAGGRVGAARRHGQRVAPGVFRTDLNSELLEGPRGQEFLMRTPMRGSGASRSSSARQCFWRRTRPAFVTGHLLVVDGGLLASGVNQ